MVKKFGDVLDIINGKNQKKVENSSGLYPIYGSGGVMGYADDYICEANTVVIGRKGSINNPIYVEEPFWNVDTAFGLVARENVLVPKYLYFFCVHYNFDKLNTTVTIPSLTKANLLKIEINVPSIDEQKQTVDKLDSIAELIQLQKEQIKQYDDLIKSRFVEMFGDIISNNKKWPIYKLNDISTSRLGKMLDAKQNTGKHMHPYLANFNVQWFGFDLSELHEMDFDDDDRTEFSLEDGDLLITEGGEVGRCAVWHNEVQNCYFQKAIHRVRCNNDIILPEYLAWWFKFHSEFNAFEDIVGGKATIAHLPGVKLKKLEIVVPDMVRQRNFVMFLEKVNKLKSVTQKSLDEMQLLMDSLMQEYFG